MNFALLPIAAIVLWQNRPDDKTLARDVTRAAIPRRPAAGRIHGQVFRVERAELEISARDGSTAGNVIDASPTHALRLRQGKEFFADKEFVIFFSPKPGQKLDGQSLAMRPMTFSQMVQQSRGPASGKKSASVPTSFHSVQVSLKPTKGGLPKTDIYLDRFSARLQFGKTTNGKVSGGIVLEVPDKEKSSVAGTFTATVKTWGSH